MKRTVKKILSVFSAVCILAGNLFCVAYAADATDSFVCTMGSSGAAAEDVSVGAFDEVCPADFPEDNGADETGFEPQLLIDISSYQRDIQWDIVQKTVLRNFILRCGFTGYGKSHSKNSDDYFEKNYEAIKAFGGNVGAYYYSCACSVEEAEAEADYVLTLLQGKQFELPIFYDVEDNHDLSQSGVFAQNQQSIGIADKKNGTSLLTDIVDTFCKKLTDAGYCCGFYSAKSWAENYLDMERLSVYPFWLAHWTTPFTTYTGSFDVWQYTDTGSVAGITGNVDMNYLFRDFPTEIKAMGRNGFKAPNVLQVNSGSARMALRISVGLEEYNLLYDYDKNGKVDAVDARLILRASVGLKEDSAKKAAQTTVNDEYIL